MPPRWYLFKFTINFIGGGALLAITKRAMVKKDYKELDEAIRGKVVQFLYNQGDGKKVPIAHLACLRNRDRSKSKQVRICTCEPCVLHTYVVKYTIQRVKAILYKTRGEYFHLST